MDHLWAELVGQLVRHGEPTGPVVLLADDTRFLKRGRHGNGSGYLRDAVRSTAQQTVPALGLKLVIRALRIQA